MIQNVTMEDMIKYIKSATKSSPDIVYRPLVIQGIPIQIVYSEPLSSQDIISNYIIRSLEKILTKQDELKKDEEKEESVESVYTNNLKVTVTKKKKKIEEQPSDDSIADKIADTIEGAQIKKINLKEDDLFYYLFSGYTLIIVEDGIVAVEAKADLNRSIDKPETEPSVKGPKDAFVENYIQNLGLIRRRIKSEKLYLEESKVGRKTKSRVGILYIGDIAKKSIVDELKQKINDIDIDGIIDSNYIREVVISGGETTVFPTIISTERPDLVSFYLLQGRIAVIVENSPYVLVFPAFIADFFKNIDDYYQKSNTSTFIRIIRYIAFFITLLTPAIYIALTTFNQEAIPSDLLVSFAVQRDGVPAPAIIECFLMILAFEILREGDFRVPNAMGSTLSIVGALILGEAAVSAGIVSPIMIIVVAITTISGLIFSDINLVNAMRTWRVIFLFFSSIAGLVGIAIAGLFFIFKLTSISIVSLPYTYPFAPFDATQIAEDTLKRTGIDKMKDRMKLLTNNITRIRSKGE